jgi:cell division protein FtsB
VKHLHLSNLTNIIGSIIALYLVIVLGQTVVHNYQLQKQIDALSQQNSSLTSQNESLTYNLQFYQTNAFSDREARAKLGLQLPGESLIILPHPSDIATAQKKATPAVKPKSNLAQWLDFLGGKV